MYKLLLSPAGRIGRQEFWRGMAVFTVLVVLFNFGLKQLGNSVWAFLISLPFPFLALHMAYSCLLYTSPSPRDKRQSRMPSSA